MAKKPLFVQWCPKDALDGMQAMEPLTELAYRRTLDLIYATNNQLPDDDERMGWMTKVGTHGWRRIKQYLMVGSDPKLFVESGFIRNKRCDAELSRVADFRAKQAVKSQAALEARSTLKNNDTGSSVGTGSGKPAGPPAGQPGPHPRDVPGVHPTVNRKPVVSKNTTPTPPRGEEVGAGAPGVGRGSRIAADWQPSEAVLLWAVEQGWTREWALSRVDEFRDFWIGVAGAKGRKLDWDATFRNRLRDTAARGKVNGSGSGTAAGDSVDLDARQWRSRVTVFANSGRWMEDLWGPAPGSAGCRAPPDVLADHGYGGLALGVPSKPAA